VITGNLLLRIGLPVPVQLYRSTGCSSIPEYWWNSTIFK